MKTDDLIAVLAAARPPAPPAWQSRLLAVGLGASVALALAGMAVTLGLRPGLSAVLFDGAVMAKLIFVVLLVAAAGLAFEGLVRPVPSGRPAWLILLPFAMMAVLAAATLGAAPAERWPALVWGRNWSVCLVAVPALAILPAAVLCLVARRRAPTDLGGASWAVGAVAGAIGALAYAFHCPDDAAPFVLLWYGVGVGACALAARLLAPRLLRW